jgi:hypothetical protein
VYFEEEPGRRSAAKLLSKDEARKPCEVARATEVAAALRSLASIQRRAFTPDFLVVPMTY